MASNEVFLDAAYAIALSVSNDQHHEQAMALRAELKLARLELIRNATSSSRVKTEFKYDANGYRLEEVQTGDEGLVARIVSVYDAKGLRTERRMYNKQGLFARRTYTYGADVHPTEEAEYDPKGGLVGKQGYSYEVDSTGNWIKRITSTQGISNGKPVSEPAAVTYRTITYY